LCTSKKIKLTIADKSDVKPKPLEDTGSTGGVMGVVDWLLFAKSVFSEDWETVPLGGEQSRTGDGDSDAGKAPRGEGEGEQDRERTGEMRLFRERFEGVDVEVVVVVVVDIEADDNAETGDAEAGILLS